MCVCVSVKRMGLSQSNASTVSYCCLVTKLCQTLLQSHEL